MKDVILVFGYGVPKDIIKDENYNIYLKMVFNKIYNLVNIGQVKAPTIVFCGGKTDMYKPYKRTEADEMIRFFKNHIKLPYLRDVVNDWKLLAERRSLSTLENLLFSKELLKRNGIKKSKIHIFCEQTRFLRIKKILKKVFDGGFEVKVIPIDFDISPNRYLDIEFLKKKEKEALRNENFALKSQENMKKYHQLFEDKIKFFREAGPNRHVDAIRDWWEMRLKEFEIK